MFAPEPSQSIVRHYEAVWRRQAFTHRPSRGPVHQLPPDFHVLHFPSRTPAEADLYATCGMSTSGEARPIEIHLRAPAPSDDHVELLTVIAHFHRTGSTLALAHTVNFGRPWVPGSSSSYGVLSLPYPDGPPLEWLDEGAQRKRRFLWLIPITKRERDFKAKHGLEALEQRFEAAAFNPVDPFRADVVDEQSP